MLTRLVVQDKDLDIEPLSSILLGPSKSVQIFRSGASHRKRKHTYTVFSVTTCPNVRSSFYVLLKSSIAQRIPPIGPSIRRLIDTLRTKDYKSTEYTKA